MAQRTALVLETNPVITERYLNYTHDSQWRIMLKDNLNDFLEKLQHERFNLIVAEESLVPQGIISMLKSTGVPLLLSTNTKNQETPVLPRNFNRTELLTVFDRLVPDFVDETPKQQEEPENDKVNEILSGLEDEDDFFELSSDSVVSEPSQDQNNENTENNEKNDLFDDQDDDLFGTSDDNLFDNKNNSADSPESSSNTAGDSFDDDEFLSDSAEPETNGTTGNIAEKEKKSSRFAPPPPSVFNEKDDEIDNLVNSLSVDFKSVKTEENAQSAETGKTSKKQNTFQQNNNFDAFLFNEEEPKEFSIDEAEGPEKPEITLVTPIPADSRATETAPEPAEQKSGSKSSEDIIRTEVRAWLDKNARSMIKEIVLEQLASLSGKNNG